MGRTARLSLLLTISVVCFAVFAVASASAAEVCTPGFSTAAFFDNAVATGECPNAPSTTTAETNSLHVTRGVADDPTTPGRQNVTSIVFHDDNNTVDLGEPAGTTAGTCQQTDANTVTCLVSR